MGRYSNQGNSEEFQDAPAGTHLARCFKIVDLGTQHDEYEGKEIIRNRVLVSWELSGEQMDNGDPFIMSKFYTNSLNKKANLRQDLEQWRGKNFTDEELASFDLEKILDLCCLISVIEKPSGKGVKVGGVMSLPKGSVLPEPVNPVFSFWIDEWSREKFDMLSDGIKKMIEASAEYQQLQGPDEHGDVPF